MDVNPRSMEPCYRSEADQPPVRQPVRWAESRQGGRAEGSWALTTVAMGVIAVHLNRTGRGNSDCKGPHVCIVSDMVYPDMVYPAGLQGQGAWR